MQSFFVVLILIDLCCDRQVGNAFVMNLTPL